MTERLQASWLLKRFSHRTVALSGIIGMAVSQFLCGFTTHNIGGLIFLQGIVFGISGAVVFLVSARFGRAGRKLIVNRCFVHVTTDRLHLTDTVVYEEARIDGRNYVVWRRSWRSSLGDRECWNFSVVPSSTEIATIPFLGHREDDRQLGTALDLSLRRLGNLDHWCRESSKMIARRIATLTMGACLYSRQHTRSDQGTLDRRV